MHIRKVLLAVLAPATLAACVTTTEPYNRQLAPESHTLIFSTEIVMPIAQTEIQNYTAPAAGSTYVPVYIPPGTSAGAAAAGGLIGALIVVGIEAGMAAVAEGEIKPLRASLADFSFDQTLQAEMKAALAQATWLNAGEPRVVKAVTSDTLNTAITGSNASGVLMIGSNYQLSPNASEVWISISPTFYPKTAELQAFRQSVPSKNAAPVNTANGIYRNSFTFRTQAPKATDDRVANIAIWSADNGAAMRAAMKQGSAKLAQMLVEDLEALPYGMIDPKTTTLAPYNSEDVSGHLLRSDADGQVIAMPGGTQLYLAMSTLEPLGQKAKSATGKNTTAVERTRAKKAQEEYERNLAKEKAKQNKPAS